MTYLAEVAIDNPTHLWSYSEPAGPYAQDTGSVDWSLASEAAPNNGFRGVATGTGAYMATSWNAAWLSFSGGRIQATPWTFEVWIYQFAKLALYQPFMSNFQANGGAGMEVTSGNKVDVFTSLGGANIFATDASDHPTNQWVHWAGRHTGTRLQLVKNGVQVADVAAVGSTAVPGAQAMIIGSYSALSSRLRGFVSAPAVYPTALSDARLLAHHDAADLRTLPPAYSGLALQSSVTTLITDMSTVLADLAQLLGDVESTYVNAP